MADISSIIAAEIARALGIAAPVATTPAPARTYQVQPLRHTAAYRDPAAWPDYVAEAAARVLSRYVSRHFGAYGVRHCGPEEREEIAARVLAEIVSSGPIPDGWPVLRWVYRHAYRAKLQRGYDRSAGYDQTRRQSKELEAALRETPSLGRSDSAHAYDPRRIAAAVSARRLSATSERMKRERIRAIRSRSPAVYIVTPGPVAGSRSAPYCQVTIERVPTWRDTAAAGGHRWNQPTWTTTTTRPTTATRLGCTTCGVIRHGRPTVAAAPVELQQRVPLPAARYETHTRLRWVGWQRAAREALGLREPARLPGSPYRWTPPQRLTMAGLIDRRPTTGPRVTYGQQRPAAAPQTEREALLSRCGLTYDPAAAAAAQSARLDAMLATN